MLYIKRWFTVYDGGSCSDIQIIINKTRNKMSLFLYSMSVRHQNCLALIIWTNLTLCTSISICYYKAVTVLEYKSWGNRQHQTINIRETPQCLKFTTLSSLWICRNVPFSRWRGAIVVGNRSVFYIFFPAP